MKKSILQKIMIAFAAFAGVFAMTSCQSANQTDAKIPTQESSVRIVEEKVDGKTEKYADVILCIDNNTIYNIDQASFSYVIHFNDGTPDEVVENELTEKGAAVLKHGVRGYLGYRLRLTNTDYENAEKITITKVDIVGFQSLWQTYIVPFIVMICIAGLSILFFAIELFRKGITKEIAKEMFKEHLASELTVLGLILIICFIPLIFSSWVTTVILLGGFVGALLVTGLLTLLKTSFSK